MDIPSTSLQQTLLHRFRTTNLPGSICIATDANVSGTWKSGFGVQILIVTNRLHQVLRPFVLRRTKDILNATLPPKTERAIPCPASLYQREMLNLLTCKESVTNIKGINNVMMECRKICNEPLLSKLHAPASDACLKDLCVPAAVQLGGKAAILLQLLLRLRSLGMQQYNAAVACWSLVGRNLSKFQAIPLTTPHS